MRVKAQPPARHNVNGQGIMRASRGIGSMHGSVARVSCVVHAASVPGCEEIKRPSLAVCDLAVCSHSMS